MIHRQGLAQAPGPAPASAASAYMEGPAMWLDDDSKAAAVGTSSTVTVTAESPIVSDSDDVQLHEQAVHCEIEMNQMS
jgi:hypothetical protein